jgi:TonB family protein
MLARLLPLALVALLAVPAQAQKPVTDDATSEVYRIVDNPPQLIGGLDGLAQEIQYPAEAKAAGVEGRVFVQFVVNEQGGVIDEKIVRGVSPELDAEALRVVRQAQFEPGSNDGQRVKVQFALPIQFRLGDERPDRSDYFGPIENPPELIGELEGLQQEIVYPEAARAAGTEGTVVVQFVVGERGEVTDASVVRSVSPALDAEALRVVRAAEFRPGMERGEPVKVRFSLPVRFRLDSDRADR